MTQTQAPGLGSTQDEHLEALGKYRCGWHDADAAGATARRGLSEDVVRNISALKDEPNWMLERRLRGHKLFGRKTIKIRQPAGERMILREMGSTTRRALPRGSTNSCVSSLPATSAAAC